MFRIASHEPVYIEYTWFTPLPNTSLLNIRNSFHISNKACVFQQTWQRHVSINNPNLCLGCDSRNGRNADIPSRRATKCQLEECAKHDVHAGLFILYIRMCLKTCFDILQNIGFCKQKPVYTNQTTDEVREHMAVTFGGICVIARMMHLRPCVMVI